MRGFLKLIAAVVLVAWKVRANEDAIPAHYYWKSTPAGESAQLVTLFCRSCEDQTGAGRDIPLVAVLRDSLGSVRSENDRISYVWLLTYSRPTWEKSMLSAVPFFYWKIGGGSDQPKAGDLKPLMNLAQARRPVVYSAARNIVQWTILDPVSTPVRASTRAYQNNRLDHERLHLEEAEGYLQSAPAADDETGLNETERNTVIARLELRKSMLGGFVNGQRAVEAGQDANLEQERVRARNWELLRQCADKTGLLFEPVDLAGAKGQYAVLWFPVERTAPPAGAPLEAVWKLLNLKDPYAERARLLEAARYQRNVEGRPAQVTPLGVYSLTYPKLPLLMIDFRDGTHLRRHELTQRAITELTSGVLGLSRLANWYYYAGAEVYDFYASRRGAAMNRSERLNSYSKFRVALALDANLDPGLRAAIERRVDSLAVNPLETSAKREMRAALGRYDLLEQTVSRENNPIARRLDKDRRVELASFEASEPQHIRSQLLHYGTLGLYTPRSKGSDFLALLEKYREADYYLTFLDGLAAAGTQPEVAYDSERLSNAVAQLSALLPDLTSPAMQAHAQRTIEKLHTLSKDLEFRAECVAALHSLDGAGAAAGAGGAAGSPETLR